MLDDDRLGRALEALAPVAEHVRGEAALAAVDAFDVEVSQLHVDLTKPQVVLLLRRSNLTN